MYIITSEISMLLELVWEGTMCIKDASPSRNRHSCPRKKKNHLITPKQIEYILLVKK